MESVNIEANAMVQAIMRQRDEGFNQVAKLAGTVAGLQAQLAEANGEITQLKEDAEKAAIAFEKLEKKLVKKA